MQKIVLSAEEQRQIGATHKFVITYTDVAALGAAAAGSITLATLAAGQLVEPVVTDLITAFDASDASINSCTLKLGDGSATAYFTASGGVELAVDGTEILFYAFNAADPALTNVKAYTGADSLLATFTVAGGASPLLNELTSGELHLYVRIIDVKKFRALRTS